MVPIITVNDALQTLFKSHAWVLLLVLKNKRKKTSADILNEWNIYFRVDVMQQSQWEFFTVRGEHYSLCVCASLLLHLTPPHMCSIECCSWINILTSAMWVFALQDCSLVPLLFDAQWPYYGPLMNNGHADQVLYIILTYCEVTIFWKC